METVIKRCDCKSSYQDSKYGKGLRVMNYGSKASPGKSEGYRCTVCGRSHPK